MELLVKSIKGLPEKIADNLLFIIITFVLATLFSHGTRVLDTKGIYWTKKILVASQNDSPELYIISTEIMNTAEKTADGVSVVIDLSRPDIIQRAISFSSKAPFDAEVQQTNSKLIIRNAKILSGDTLNITLIANPGTKIDLGVAVNSNNLPSRSVDPYDARQLDNRFSWKQVLFLIGCAALLFFMLGQLYQFYKSTRG